jgi:hypothetical protein
MARYALAGGLLPASTAVVACHKVVADHVPDPPAENRVAPSKCDEVNTERRGTCQQCVSTSGWVGDKKVECVWLLDAKRPHCVTETEAAGAKSIADLRGCEAAVDGGRP